MNELKQFTNGSFNLPVRQLADGSIEFDAERAAIGLGITQIAKSGNEVVRWERINKYLSIPTSGDEIRRGDFITEPQFYKLAIKANNEKAEHFQDWVTNDVLPSIRKNGMYATPQAAEQLLNNPDMMIEILTRYKDSQAENQRLHDENEKLQAPALLGTAVAASTEAVSVGTYAKVLAQSGVDIGQNRLFKWLRENGYLISSGRRYNAPTQRAIELGVLEVRESVISTNHGNKPRFTPLVTGKGQQYFANKFLKVEEVAL